MNSTKTTSLVKGVTVTEEAVVFDYKANKEGSDKHAKFTILVGAFCIFLAGLGVIAIVLGALQLMRKPEQYITLNKKYLENLSRKTGKPIKYINLPPELQHYASQAPDAEATKGQLISEVEQQEEEQEGALTKNTDFCIYCGSKLKPNSKFCPECGKQV